MIFGIRDIIRNSAAFVGCKSARDGKFGKQACIGRSVTNLNGIFERRCNLAANINAVVYDGKSVQHGASGFLAFFNSGFGFVVAVQTRVTVHGCGKQVGFAFSFEKSEQFDMLFVKCNPRTRLNECNSVRIGLREFFSKAFFLRNRFLVSHGFVEIDVFSGMPMAENFLALGKESVV